MITINEIIAEIDRQIESTKYLRDHQEIAKKTICQETPEFCRGALSMLDYLKWYIQLNNNNEGR